MAIQPSIYPPTAPVGRCGAPTHRGPLQGTAHHRMLVRCDCHQLRRRSVHPCPNEGCRRQEPCRVLINPDCGFWIEADREPRADFAMSALVCPGCAPSSWNDIRRQSWIDGRSDDLDATLELALRRGVLTEAQVDAKTDELARGETGEAQA